MVASSRYGDLLPAVDLIMQPLLLEALVAIDEGKTMEDALLTDTDAEPLHAALQRLSAMGAVVLSPNGPLGRHTLTPRGRKLIVLLEDLGATIQAARAGRSRVTRK